jgi:hypothetical protein
MNYHSSILKFLGVLIFLFATFASQAFATTYYIAATEGSNTNSGLSPSAAWATFAHAQTKVGPGDTLIVMDGTYTEAVKWTRSGTATNPITIKAQNDGQAVIDGEKQRQPWKMARADEGQIIGVTIEGMVFKNSPSDVFTCKVCDRVNLKRVSAYNAGDGNYNMIGYGSSTNSLIEDIVASGGGRIAISAFESNFMTLRRVFVYGTSAGQSEGGGNPNFLKLYKTNDSIVENLVGTQVSGLRIPGAVQDYCKMASADRNKFYASVVYDLFDATSAFKRTTDNNTPQSCKDGQYHHLVSIGNVWGFEVEAGINSMIRNMTVIGKNTSTDIYGINLSPEALGGGLEVDIRNSIFATGNVGFRVRQDPLVLSFTHSYNNVFNFNQDYENTTKGTGEVDMNPTWDTAKYGKGAYLIQPAALKGKGEGGSNMGAEVLYQYVNGVKTATPLWPWPMEDRICKELGISVTYENNGAGCTGGLWKTLDGVYAESPPGPDTIPPSSPTGLQAN